MAIPEWKRSAWQRRVDTWSYKTLLGQLEELLYLEELLEREIRERNRKLIEQEWTFEDEVLEHKKEARMWTAEDA